MNARAELATLLEAARLVLVRRGYKALPPKSEPDAAAKLKAEKKLAAVVGAYFARLAKRATAILLSGPPAEEKAVVIGWDTDDFWDDPEFVADLLAILVAANKLGVLSLPAMLGLDLDLTATNTEAEAAARQYAYDLIKDLTATSREALQTVIGDFVSTPGMTIGDVIDRLPFSEQRAALIATTEITRAYATGQAAAGAALAEQYPDVRVVKEWHSNRDEAVCPICSPLDGVEVDEDEQFDNEFDGPPSHPGCRCWVSYRTRING